jgi:hypothetical protein
LFSASVGTSHSQRPLVGNDSRIHYSCVVRVLAHRIPKVLRIVTIPEFLTQKDLYRLSIVFLKFVHENVSKMKNKPDPALLRTSNLSNELKNGYQNLVKPSL